MRRLASILIGLVAGSMFVLLLYLILRPKGPRKVQLFVEDAEEVKDSPAKPAPKTDNLESIIGIGPAYARRLNDAGIDSFADLAGSSPSRLAEIIGARARPSDIESWIAQAKGLK